MPIILHYTHYRRACTAYSCGMWSGTTHRTSPTQLNTTRVFALTHLVPRPTIGCKSCRIPPQRLHRARTICAAVQQDSLYSILGIERDATLAEINSAYREAVRSFDSPTETLHQAHCKQEVGSNAPFATVVSYAHRLCLFRLSRMLMTCSAMTASDECITCMALKVLISNPARTEPQVCTIWYVDTVPVYQCGTSPQSTPYL